MKQYAVYVECNKDMILIKWLWEILKEFNQLERSSFLFFTSGSSKPPFGGFKSF